MQLNNLIYWVSIPILGSEASLISGERPIADARSSSSHIFNSSAISSLPERTTLMAAALSEFLTCTP